jgi:heme A synthase
MPDLTPIHGMLRYLVLLAGFAAAFYALAGWARAREFDRTSRILGAAFTGLLDLQVLIGVLNLLSRPFRPVLFGHIAMMLVALGVAHAATFRSKRLPPSANALRFQFLGIVIALGLVMAGIMALGRGAV